MKVPSKLRFLIPVLFAGVVASTVSCATGSDQVYDQKAAEEAAASLDPTRAMSPDEASAYREIQSLYSEGKYDAALQKLQSFERAFPQSRHLGHVMNLRGLCHLLTRRPLQAIYHFNRALEVNTQSSFRQFVLYNLAAAQFEVNRTEEAEDSLSDIDAVRLDRDTRVKYHSLKSRILLRQGSWAESVREVLLASRFLADQSPREPFQDQLRDTLKQISSTSDLQKLYSEFSDVQMADLVLFRLGTLELTAGRLSSGEGYLKELISKHPQSLHFAEATDLVRSIQEKATADGTVVGVLLPMKGKFSKFGEQSLQAIELAFRIFNANEPDSKITLVVEDSGDETGTAVKALNRLFFKHRAVAVIGPLLSKGIDDVTRRAEELSIPLITLSQQSGNSNPYVFQSGLTPELQAEEIARYAIEHLGLRKFAILHPKDRFGEQYSQAYWDAVEKLGGKIVAVESYTAGETDFRQAVDRLSGLYYPEARQREIDALAKKREEENVTKRTRKTVQYFDLPPIVEYEAVFIPDGPKTVGSALPTFAYRDVDSVKFLGISTWHSEELIQRAQKHAEGATFVDAFYSESSSSVVKQFVEKYQATYGQSPTAMEALAYDAARILEKVLASGASSRDAVRGKLRDIQLFPGVTGRITYRDGRFSRGLHVLSIQGGAILQLDH